MQLTVRYKNLEGPIFGEWETWQKAEKKEQNRKLFTILMNDKKLHVSDQSSWNTLLIFLMFYVRTKNTIVFDGVLINQINNYKIPVKHKM